MIAFLRGQMARGHVRDLFSPAIAAAAQAAGFMNESRFILRAYETGGLEEIRNACNRPYDYASCFEAAIKRMMAGGMGMRDVSEVMMYYGEALGFPAYCSLEDVEVQSLTDSVGNSSFVYTGEVERGRENGFGRRLRYYDGCPDGIDECVWVDGEMFGYWTAVESQLGSDVKKIGFIVKDSIMNEQITYEDGTVERQVYEVL